MKNGEDKRFFAKCNKCATEMEYSLSDVKTEIVNAVYKTKIKSIVCPVCGEPIPVNLLTKEEFYQENKNGYLGYAFNS